MQDSGVQFWEEGVKYKPKLLEIVLKINFNWVGWKSFDLESVMYDFHMYAQPFLKETVLQ